jgi:hypothetical protein
MSCDFAEMSWAIWYDIGQPTSLTVDAIQARLESNFFVGKINNLLGTCFSFVGGVITPDMESSEQDIYMELYKNSYYSQKITENLGAGGLGFTTIKEGDTTFTKVSPTELAKNYQVLKTNSDENIKNLVNSYLSNKSGALSSDFYDIW